MARHEARLDINENAITAEMLLEYGYLAEEGAKILEEEIKALIPDSEGPSPPGQPPHSPGPLRDSFHAGSAKRKGNRMTAWTFSLAEASDGSSLPELLDKGSANVAPRPFLDQAEINAQRRIDAMAAQAGRR